MFYNVGERRDVIGRRWFSSDYFSYEGMQKLPLFCLLDFIMHILLILNGHELEKNALKNINIKW